MTDSGQPVAYRVDNDGKPWAYHVDEQYAEAEAAGLPGGGGSVTPVTLSRLVAGLNELVPAVRGGSIRGPGR